MVVLLALAGASYQAIESRLDARRFPETGRLVDVGGYRLMLNCIGDGSPTVVLEAGFGDLSVEWKSVQQQIAKFSRVCSYDRAGYGGSDAGPLPRTSLQIARELHTLLKNAGEKTPYILVGASFGGYNVRVFNGLYRDEVTGIVLADATQEDQYDTLPQCGATETLPAPGEVCFFRCRSWPWPPHASSPGGGQRSVFDSPKKVFES